MKKKKKQLKRKPHIDEEDDKDQTLSIIHVAIPEEEDDFPSSLRSVPSFKALLKTYLPMCDAFVIVPWLHEESIIVPRQWIVSKNQDLGSEGHYLLDDGATIKGGESVGGQWTPATVVDELDGGDLVLLLTDFDPADWFSAYAVCGAKDVPHRFKEEKKKKQKK